MSDTVVINGQMSLSNTVNGQGSAIISSAPSIGTDLITFTLDEETGYMVCNKTWQELYDEFMQGTRIICIEELEVEGTVGQIMYPLYAVVPANGDDSKYEIVFFDSKFGDSWSAECDSADDYPAYEN